MNWPRTVWFCIPKCRYDTGKSDVIRPIMTALPYWPSARKQLRRCVDAAACGGVGLAAEAARGRRDDEGLARLQARAAQACVRDERLRDDGEVGEGVAEAAGCGGGLVRRGSSRGPGVFERGAHVLRVRAGGPVGGGEGFGGWGGAVPKAPEELEVWVVAGRG